MWIRGRFFAPSFSREMVTLWLSEILQGVFVTLFVISAVFSRNPSVYKRRFENARRGTVPGQSDQKVTQQWIESDLSDRLVAFESLLSDFCDTLPGTQKSLLSHFLVSSDVGVYMGHFWVTILIWQVASMQKEPTLQLSICACCSASSLFVVARSLWLREALTRCGSRSSSISYPHPAP